ncbi:MAG: TlpA family protein disulfide reductase [Chloroflexi bacterium]|nr:TlpA family protein disulfide reductase [Chloroflexota bacterium]
MTARRVVALVSGFALVIFVALLGLAIARQAQPGLSGEGPRRLVGQPAPDFTITTFDGQQLTLSQYRGQPVVVNFWASWCPPCRAEAPTLERTWQEYRERGVVFIGIDIEDTEADALAFLQQFGITYPNGPDPQGGITRDYGVLYIPTTLFVSRTGKVVQRWESAIGQAKLTQLVDELLLAP